MARALWTAAAEADLQCSGRDQLRDPGHGPPHACLRSRQTGRAALSCAARAAGKSCGRLMASSVSLEPEDLVVADEKKALGLAGVMGGWDTMITPETKNILVEAAGLIRRAVRRSARRHGLHTDASHRFETGRGFQRYATGLSVGEPDHPRFRWACRRGDDRRGGGGSCDADSTPSVHRAQSSLKYAACWGPPKTGAAWSRKPQRPSSRLWAVACKRPAKASTRSRCRAGGSIWTRDRPD